MAIFSAFVSFQININTFTSKYTDIFSGLRTKQKPGVNTSWGNQLQMSNHLLENHVIRNIKYSKDRYAKNDYISTP